mmetsp:Transcript_27641/g.80772  ORF Transcript_27641/g.80772 Transcript_27641/m.80772 type:complete len:220 (+) Transcript_27641:589-1248(+)
MSASSVGTPPTSGMPHALCSAIARSAPQKSTWTVWRSRPSRTTSGSARLLAGQALCACLKAPPLLLPRPPLSLGMPLHPRLSSRHQDLASSASSDHLFLASNPRTQASNLLNSCVPVMSPRRGPGRSRSRRTSGTRPSQSRSRTWLSVVIAGAESLMRRMRHNPKCRGLGPGLCTAFRVLSPSPSCPRSAKSQLPEEIPSSGEPWSRRRPRTTPSARQG